MDREPVINLEIPFKILFISVMLFGLRHFSGVSHLFLFCVEVLLAPRADCLPVVKPSALANPAKLVGAVPASNMHAASVLLDEGLALGTGPRVDLGPFKKL